ncbi:MAG: hypothetical protein JWO31_1607 [Phycisphaerales bacterium]|nr:hypothetical protein [Phycisphaerales bacterium]
MTPNDVQSLFLERLGVSLGDEMTDYLIRRFQEGGAAAVPASAREVVDPGFDPIRRFAELANALGHGAVVPAVVHEPEVH